MWGRWRRVSMGRGSVRWVEVWAAGGQTSFGHTKRPPTPSVERGAYVWADLQFNSGQELASHDEALHLVRALVDLRDRLGVLVRGLGCVFPG